MEGTHSHPNKRNEINGSGTLELRIEHIKIPSTNTNTYVCVHVRAYCITNGGSYQDEKKKNEKNRILCMNGVLLFTMLISTSLESSTSSSSSLKM